MKKFLLYFVLINYALVMVKPMMPYVFDLIAHSFFLTKHMATIHFENGKYHIHAELAKQSEDQSSDKNTNTNTKKPTLSEHTIFLNTTNIISKSIVIITYNTTPNSITAVGNCSKIYPPPRI